jgi:putative transposase
MQAKSLCINRIPTSERLSMRHTKPSSLDLTASSIFIQNIDLHRKFEGGIKTVTVSRTTTNKYFVSILVDNGQQIPVKKPIAEQSAVGIDLGIKDFCIASDGKKFENKDFLKSTMQKLRVAQRSLARKKMGSNHYNKQKLVVALLHEKVRNQRQDYLHKIS